MIMLNMLLTVWYMYFEANNCRSAEIAKIEELQELEDRNALSLKTRGSFHF